MNMPTSTRRTVIIDIETDDVNATVIHCIVCKDIDTDEIFTFIQEDCYTVFPEFARTVGHWIGHNALSFDCPTLKKLLNLDIALKDITDTLIMSRLEKPDREGGHSLKSWGERIARLSGKEDDKKIEFHDFSKYTEEMLTYCIQDVHVCHTVFKHLKKRLTGFSIQSIRMEHTFRWLIDVQQRNGFYFDIEKATLLRAELMEELRTLEDTVHKTMLPLPKLIREVAPKYKKDGTLSTVGLKKLGDDWTNVEGMFSLIDFPPFNLGSRQQIAEQLKRRGWKPKKFTEKGSVVVDESVLKGVDIPEAQLIYRYLVVLKTEGQIRNWLSAYNYETGCIHGYVNTLGANTNRCTHSSPNVTQTPAVSVDNEGHPIKGFKGGYGWECRDLWQTRDPRNRQLVGTDASGLELRCLAHYLNDTNFTTELLSGDIHTANQNMAGLPTRASAKTFIYALLYGAGPAKIGSIVSGGAKEGKTLINQYMDNLPALKRLKSNVEKAAEKGRIRAIDGRILNIRSTHSSLNTLLQGMGAIVCKYWAVELMTLVKRENLDVLFVANIHDEIQADVAKPHIERYMELTNIAIRNVEKKLELNCPLDSEAKQGLSWAETH